MALEAIKEQNTLNQIASRYDVLSVQLSRWKALLLLQGIPDAFPSGSKSKDPQLDWEREKKQFYREIGQLEMERDWLKKSERLGNLPAGNTYYCLISRRICQ